MPVLFSVRCATFSCAAILCVAAASTARLQAQDKPETPKGDYVKAHYTKYGYRIPMRDGVRLFTSVSVPKDQSQTWPILMDRTPYRQFLKPAAAKNCVNK